MSITVAIRSCLNDEHGDGPAYATLVLDRGLCQKIRERRLVYDTLRRTDADLLEHTYADAACTFREDTADTTFDEMLDTNEFAIVDDGTPVGEAYTHESGPYMVINSQGVYWTGLDFETALLWWDDFDKLADEAGKESVRKPRRARRARRSA